MGNKGFIVVVSVLIIIVISPIFSGALSNKSAKGTYKKISFEEMNQLIKNANLKEYVILDVRTVEEYNEKRIPNSVLIPDYEINRAENIIKNKEKYIFVYCRSGNRSKRAVINLLNMGYKNVYDVGGIINYPYKLEYQ